MRVILFDLDDTLFDHKHSSRMGLVAVQDRFAGRMNQSLDDLEVIYRELLERWHVRVLDGSISIDEARIERFRILLSNDQAVATDEEVRVAVDCYRDAYHEAIQAVPGSVELLRRVKTDHAIGVVTNHVVAEQVKKIAAIGIEPFVDELVVSEEVGVSKPDAQIFEVALSRLGGTPAEAVMVGDSWSSDILGAKGAGIQAIWLNRYGTPCPDPNCAIEIGALEPVDRVLELILGEF